MTSLRLLFNLKHIFHKLRETCLSQKRKRGLRDVALCKCSQEEEHKNNERRKKSD